MPTRSRNLLIFLALAGAAIATWLISREPDTPVAPSRSGTPPPRGYYLVDAVLLETDDDGQIHSRIHAQRLEQRAGGENFELDGISVEYALEADARWQLNAASGLMPRDRSFFELHEVEIRLTRTANGELTVFETSELRLDAERSLASTDQQVRVRNAEGEVVIEGMKIDFEAGTYDPGPYAITIRSEP